MYILENLEQVGKHQGSSQLTPPLAILGELLHTADLQAAFSSTGSTYI